MFHFYDGPSVDTKKKKNQKCNPHLPISLLSMGPHRLSRRELSSTPQKRASAGPCLELFISLFANSRISYVGHCIIGDD